MKTQSKNTIFLFYVYITETNAGGHGKCVGTSLMFSRSPKLSKSTWHFSESITIGISMQMVICCCATFRFHLGALEGVAGKMTSCEGYWVSEAQLRICQSHWRLVTSPRSSMPQRKRASHNPSRRNGDFWFEMLQSQRFCDNPLWPRSYSYIA